VLLCDRCSLVGRGLNGGDGLGVIGRSPNATLMPHNTNPIQPNRQNTNPTQVYNTGGLHKPRLVLTIHNMDNTGEVGGGVLGLGLGFGVGVGVVFQVSAAHP